MTRLGKRNIVHLTDEEKKARSKAYKQLFKLDKDIKISCQCPMCGCTHYILDKPPLPRIMPLKRFCKSCANFADDDYEDTYSVRLY
jgi:hypothetical protein